MLRSPPCIHRVRAQVVVFLAYLSLSQPILSPPLPCTEGPRHVLEGKELSH